MNTNKERYRKWCEQDKTMPFFYRYDYYQAIYHDNWEIALATNGNDIQAAMPYVVRKKKGFNLILPEPLMPYQGVWINYPLNQKYASKLGFEKEVITKIIEQLPSVALFRQQFHPNFTNWLPFAWENYKQTTKYSYIIEDISDLKIVYDEFKDKTRNSIKKATQNFSVKAAASIDEFIDFKRNNSNINALNLIILKRILNFAFDNNLGEILHAKNSENEICSSIFYIWDDSTAYLLQSINNKKTNYSGATSLLIWEAIKNASSKTKSFDFEGSMIQSIETFFRSFGGKQTPYFEINKTNHPLLKLLRY